MKYLSNWLFAPKLKVLQLNKIIYPLSSSKADLKFNDFLLLVLSSGNSSNVLNPIMIKNTVLLQGRLLLPKSILDSLKAQWLFYSPK